ncbi:hypothetical protein SteCoe_10066 [Stentor coeruleus]|uniref:non-specific serine/threonine protein kinase n=1 Tax=Stentor coeruleus TaxID=5963 RepID=A0A1R2CGD2_9CILI|nr:hypothetical protein SteCoe_10066 [Stentor coeruleus]
MSISDFEILSKLGEGAFSSVYKVRRKSDNQFYALKKVQLGSLKQKEKENALNEVRILASISHPNIIAYKEVFIDDSSNLLCIIMELAEGGDLLKKINDQKSSRSFFPENEILSTLVHVTQGLKILHDSKILHRDLKCANIFISREGVMKLGDLNVSKVNKRGLAYTQTGTPYYASPEVWKDQPYNSSSDIWSLGCVIYEMVALTPPFTASDMKGLYTKIIRGIYPDIPSQYSSDLSSIIKSLLQTNPSLRPNCDKILQLPLVQKYINIQLLPNLQKADLLSTIKFEPRMTNLKQKLPGPNYDNKNRGLSAHAKRPDIEIQQKRILSAKGRDRQVNAYDLKPGVKLGQEIYVREIQKVVCKPEVYEGKNQGKELKKQEIRGEIYEIGSKIIAGGRDLDKDKGSLNYIGIYQGDKYNQDNKLKNLPSGVSGAKNVENEIYSQKPSSRGDSYGPKALSRENSSQPRSASRENPTNLYNPSRPIAQIPYQQYINKPPSRDKPPVYIPPRELSSREKKPQSMQYAPSKDLVNYSKKISNSYDALINLPQQNEKPYNPIPQPIIPSSRDKISNPIYGGQDYISSKDKAQIPYNIINPPLKEKYSPFVPKNIPSSRENKPVIPQPGNRNGQVSREVRVPSREAEGVKKFNRIGAMVLQSPIQIVPKSLPKSNSNHDIRHQYMQKGVKQQVINPVWMR